MFAKSLQQDPNLITSVRYLARDKKNPMAKSIKGLLLKQGIITKGPDGLPNMDPDSALAQIIFVVTQVCVSLKFLWKPFPCVKKNILSFYISSLMIRRVSGDLHGLDVTTCGTSLLILLGVIHLFRHCLQRGCLERGLLLY